MNCKVLYMRFRGKVGGFTIILFCISLSLFLPYSLKPTAYGLSEAIAAHEMGVFSVDRRARLSSSPSGMGLTYSLDFADVSAADEIKLADANGDGQIDEVEKKIYFIGLARRVREGLRLSVNQQPTEIKLQSMKGEFPENEAGIKTVRADFLFLAGLPKDWRGGSVIIDDAVFSQRIGVRELTVDPPPGWSIQTQEGKPRDSVYLFEGPKGIGPWSARLQINPPGQAPTAQASRPGAQAVKAGQKPMSKHYVVPNLALWTLLLAFMVGVGHSLTPGHGQSLASAYLVGQRGTFRHAALLGWVVTAIRTTPVFAIGVVALLLDRYLLAERSLWWLRLLSAATLVAIGLFIIFWSLSNFVEKEQKAPTGMTTTELVGLGITGALLPPPSALALLLGAFSYDQAVLGLGLVVAFGLGLEAMMTLIGFFRVKTPSVADRIEDFAERMSRLPFFWGITIIVAGAILLAHAIRV